MKNPTCYSLFAVFICMLLQCSQDGNSLAAIGNGNVLPDGTSVPVILEQNYPNPFNPSTTIQFRTSLPIIVKVAVYSDDWREVRVLMDRGIPTGTYALQFDGKNTDGEDLASGEYFYVLESGTLQLVRKMKLLK